MAEHGPRDRFAAVRRSHRDTGLAEGDLAATWHDQFAAWLRDATAAGLSDPTAMVLATATGDGTPAARLVLLKAHDPAGFVFYTNHESAKGAELAANPRAQLVFPWLDIDRQVRVAGTVERLSAAESAGYFASRPRGSQLAAWASRQSTVIADRDVLLRAVAARSTEFAEREVPCPPFWGGYRVRPVTVEFWQGRDDRLHDRLRYRQHADGWLRERLAP